MIGCCIELPANYGLIVASRGTRFGGDSIASGALMDLCECEAEKMLADMHVAMDGLAYMT